MTGLCPGSLAGSASLSLTSSGSQTTVPSSLKSPIGTISGGTRNIDHPAFTTDLVLEILSSD